MKRPTCCQHRRRCTSTNHLPLLRGVLLFGGAKSPRLVCFDALAGQIDERMVLVNRAELADFEQEAKNRVLADSRHPNDRANRVAFDQSAKDDSTAGVSELVHTC